MRRSVASSVKCRYQGEADPTEVARALDLAQCYMCGVTERELELRGQHLEVCGDEFGSDIVTGERVLTPIALCPRCHRENHLDARRRHNPNPEDARRGREGLD